jgi:hypothetical protein
LEAEDLAQRLADMQRQVRSGSHQLKRAADVVAALDDLAELAGQAVLQDPKLAQLAAEVQVIRQAEPHANVLVYSEYVDSQRAAAEALRAAGVGQVLLMSGEDDEHTRQQITERFRRAGDLVLVSTDTAAEGLNLHQRCHHLIHLELPFNPNRLDQRNGRIDHYGQTQTPLVRYFYLRGSFEERILLRLVAKFERQRALLTFVPGTLTKEQIDPWGLSLAYALHTGLCQLYMLDGREVGIDLEGPWPDCAGQSELGLVALSFIDHSLGGAGYLQRAAGEFHLVAQRAIQHLDHANCETACYRCLKSYTNQRHHEVLSWPLAMPYLEALASAAPAVRPLQAGDLDDPGLWLEAYAAGVGSPLELKFLRLFEQPGFHPEKQVPIVLTPGGRPITLADFAVPERRLAIYIDGASVHVGQNLRRDRNIRDRLRTAEPAWTAV